VTIGGALQSARKQLAKAGIDSPALDAALLLSGVLGTNRTRLALVTNEPLDAETLRRFDARIERRCSGEPVAYILGRKEFRGLDFTVSPAVLIPRPDTETLVEAALEYLDQEGAKPPALRRFAAGRKRFSTTPETGGPTPVTPPARGWPPDSPQRQMPFSVLDLCTGSGAVAISLKNERPTLSVYASDISAEALALAEANAARLLGADAITFLQSDLFASFGSDSPPLRRRFSLIVSNPPYIKTGEIPHLQAEVRREPALALDGGGDGLGLIRRIIVEAGDYLIPGGTLLLEADPAQMETVAGLLAERGFTGIQTYRDLAQRERVIAGTR
jgi:release factor glutamine methyltransferase